MKLSSLLALLFLSSYAMGQETFTKPAIPPIDTCHSLLDLPYYSKEDSMSLKELLSLDTLYFSVNQCTDAEDEWIRIASCKMITVPIDGPATLIHCTDGLLGQKHKDLITPLASGSMVIFEAITYTKESERLGLKPVILRIR
jgi:hypothetical protein